MFCAAFICLQLGLVIFDKRMLAQKLLFCANIHSPKNCKIQTVIREKLCKALSYKKGARKMLLKITAGHRGVAGLEVETGWSLEAVVHPRVSPLLLQQ
jgi:hypothetical protein